MNMSIKLIHVYLNNFGNKCLKSKLKYVFYPYSERRTGIKQPAYYQKIISPLCLSIMGIESLVLSIPILFLTLRNTSTQKKLLLNQPNKTSPSISSGLSTFITFNKVGATSANFPFRTFNPFNSSSFVRKNIGTILVV